MTKCPTMPDLADFESLHLTIYIHFEFTKINLWIRAERREKVKFNLMLDKFSPIFPCLKTHQQHGMAVVGKFGFSSAISFMIFCFCSSFTSIYWLILMDIRLQLHSSHSCTNYWYAAETSHFLFEYQPSWQSSIIHSSQFCCFTCLN